MESAEARRESPPPPVAGIGRFLTALGVGTASPWVFLLFVAYAAAWIAFGSLLDWHEVATLASAPVSGTEDALTHIDEEEPEVIERKRDAPQH
jgi:hypothetical protein